MAFFFERFSTERFMNNTCHVLQWDFIAGSFELDEIGNLSNTSNWLEI